MDKNKTVFQFQLNGNMAMAESVIRNWLSANQYKFETRPNANYYAYNEPMIKGKRGLEYYINGNTVTIVAYLGTFEKPISLDGIAGALGKQAYRNDLTPLFEQLKKLDNGEQPVQQPYGQPIQQTNQPTQQPYGQSMQPSGQSIPQSAPMQDNSLNVFVEQNNKRQETLVIVGFVLSIVGVMASCFGVAFGAIIIAFEFYCACQGLKTKKRGLAIATIVLTSISILILLLSVILQVIMMA